MKPVEMHNPPHPGEFIETTYIEENGLTRTELAESLGVSLSAVSRLVSTQSALSPELAIRLEAATGIAATTWLAMQSAHDVWQTKQRLDVSRSVTTLFGKSA